MILGFRNFISTFAIIIAVAWCPISMANKLKVETRGSDSPKLESKKSRKTASKLTQTGIHARCLARPLRLKDCHLQSNNRKIHVWQDKVFLTTDIAHDLQPIPIPAADDWEFIRLTNFANRDLLEVAVWTPPSGASEVSSLVWTIFEFDDRKLVQRVQSVIQKRKLNEQSKKYEYDRQFEFGLGAKGNEIIWTADKENGRF